MWTFSWSLYMGVCIEGTSPWRNLSSNSGEEGIVGNIVPLIVTKQMLDPFIASSSMMVGGGPVWFNWPVSSVLLHPTGKSKGEQTKCRVSHQGCWQVYKQPVMLRAIGGPWVELCRSLMMESMNVDIPLCFHANWHETQGMRDFLTVDYKA